MNNAIVPIVASLLHATQARKVVYLFILVIDRSMSMLQHVSAVKEMVGSVEQDIQNAPQGVEDVLLSILTFADESRIDVQPTPVCNVGPFTSYRPDGLTALYAAADDALDLALTFKDGLARGGQDTKLVCNVIVFSDGDDNRSPERQAGLRRKARQAIDLGFKLRAIGIGISHEALARQLGFRVQDGLTVSADTAGFRTASKEVSMTFTGSMGSDSLRRR